MGTATMAMNQLLELTDTNGVRHTIPLVSSVGSLTEYSGIRTHTIGTETNILAWDPVNSSLAEMSSFDVLYLWSTGVVHVELTANEGDANETVFTIPLTANLCFPFHADDSFYNGGLAGTLDVIDRMRARNPSDSATVQFSWAMGKL